MAQCCQSGSILDDGTGDNRRADGSRPTGGVVGGVVLCQNFKIYII